MKMTTKHGINALAVALAAFAMACTDATSPARTLAVDGVSGTVTTSPTFTLPAGMASWGTVRVCKTIAADDPAQTFSFTATVTPLIPPGAALAPINFNIDALPNQTVCANPYVSTKNGAQLDQIVVVENGPPTDWTLTNIDVLRTLSGFGYLPPAPGMTDTESEATLTATVYSNNDMARTVTFTNDFTTTGCTYTKGWYRNHGSSTVIAVDGRSVTDAQAIFNATPGKPGGVTFEGNNTLLNLYQQFLAALNNLGGDANEDDGPAAVDAAIDDVQAGTSDGPGLVITTTLTQTEMSDLIGVLSAFNEGDYAGWPHCTD
jgi:hypothetical protein